MANIAIAQPGASHSPSASFHQFPILPPELRFIIWEQAYLEIVKEGPQNWELLLRDAKDGGAVVTKRDRSNTPFVAGPLRDQYIINLRMASREANCCFTTYILMKVFTPAPYMVEPWKRYTLGRMAMTRVWLCPEADEWIFNFEFNMRHSGHLPLFDDWMSELEEENNSRTLHNSLVVLGSIGHLRMGFWALAGYTEHNIDQFLDSLPQLSRLSIHLEPIPCNDVPYIFDSMMPKLQGGDFSYENRHFAAHCFFQEVGHVEFSGGKVAVPESATKDIQVPDEQVLASKDYEFLRRCVRVELEYAAYPTYRPTGLNRGDIQNLIGRWVTLGDRGVERVMATRITSVQRQFGQFPKLKPVEPKPSGWNKLRCTMA
ncbi:hypothetical protein PG997_012515 [Apiospora hydei]|uniref:Uncharacterized protein n=1 Tax=Apiospora hydei TaxID=1337664 RepID=A0ABR1V3M4_9PEZI